jgi:hypothetical protein
MSRFNDDTTLTIHVPDFELFEVIVIKDQHAPGAVL